MSIRKNFCFEPICWWTGTAFLVLIASLVLMYWQGVNYAQVMFVEHHLMIVPSRWAKVPGNLGFAWMVTDWAIPALSIILLYLKRENTVSNLAKMFVSLNFGYYIFSLGIGEASLSWAAWAIHHSHGVAYLVPEYAGTILRSGLQAVWMLPAGITLLGCFIRIAFTKQKSQS